MCRKVDAVASSSLRFDTWRAILTDVMDSKVEVEDLEDRGILLVEEVVSMFTRYVDNSVTLSGVCCWTFFIFKIDANNHVPCWIEWSPVHGVSSKLSNDGLPMFLEF